MKGNSETGINEFLKGNYLWICRDSMHETILYFKEIMLYLNYINLKKLLCLEKISDRQYII